jgi:hypothetical protein
MTMQARTAEPSWNYPAHKQNPASRAFLQLRGVSVGVNECLV